MSIDNKQKRYHMHLELHGVNFYSAIILIKMYEKRHWKNVIFNKVLCALPVALMKITILCKYSSHIFYKHE